MSKIKFLEEQFIEICVGFDNNEEPIMQEEKVSKGEEFEVDIIDDEVSDDIIQVQFGDGSVSFIYKEWVENMDAEEEEE